MFAAMLAWNSDFAFLYADIAGTGLLPVEAENQGKLVVTTEMGGGEAIPARVHRITQSGLRNVLIHVGALKGREQTRASLGLPPIDSHPGAAARRLPARAGVGHF